MTDKQLREMAEAIVRRCPKMIPHEALSIIFEEAEKALRTVRNQALEEAAKACENSVKWYASMNINECTKTPTELAKDIRSLKQGDTVKNEKAPAKE